MGGIGVGVAILLLIAFIAGVVAGLVVVVSVASRREDRLFTLTGAAPGTACKGARVLVGASVRGHVAPGGPPDERDDGDLTGTGWEPGQ